MRHIYRKESSWLDFASKEYDYNRVAVTSYFLGLASMRYDRESRSFAIAEADRELLGVEAILRDVNTTTEETVTTICEQLGLPLVSRPADLVTLRTALQNELANLSQQRNNIIEGQYEVGPDFSSAVSPVGYDSTLTERYEAVSVDLQRAVEVVADLRIVVREHEQSLRLVEADRGRLNRLLGAVEVFDDLPVRMCPACEQDVSPNRDHDSGSCYLCFQPVIEDRRRRRAEMEMRALDSEVREINEAQARAERDLANATASEERLRQKQTDLANELNNTRAAQLAPFMAALEDVASQSAKINQQLAALPAIEQVLTRQHHAQIRVDEAARTVDETASIQVDEATYIRESRRRCANLADRMNEFLSNFRGRGWVGSEVTVSAQELTFYVGTRTWEEQLGAEARVLFFLAYSYALLALTQDLGEEGNAPGLLIMDNPYQHDLNDDVVRESLELIGNLAASNGTQLITTQSRSASDIRSPHAEIIMQNEYTFDQEDE
ncbi:hypothetical protein [Saccharothrix sp. ALI-22-I]|uniref:hypothetical protein n=1 Tax=Saccharothrix sp. ALI-22-I TaxID=1933778 RepID=UPI001179E81E|nr:hypothetical protein [Saccharothrix sp. ALI-22-I]